MSRLDNATALGCPGHTYMHLGPNSCPLSMNASIFSRAVLRSIDAVAMQVDTAGHWETNGHPPLPWDSNHEMRHRMHALFRSCSTLLPKAGHHFVFLASASVQPGVWEKGLNITHRSTSAPEALFSPLHIIDCSSLRPRAQHLYLYVLGGLQYSDLFPLLVEGYAPSSRPQSRRTRLLPNTITLRQPVT
jgi:hypothetical protein